MKPQPWEPADATDFIRKIGTDPNLDIWQTEHYKQRLLERDLRQSDVLFLLKHGFVYNSPKPSSQPNYYIYELEGKATTFESRSVRLVVIPDWKSKSIKFGNYSAPKATKRCHCEAFS